MALGRTIRREITRYLNVPATVVNRISSPTRILRKGPKKVFRWPARPTLPVGPGRAVPGMCPTASRSVRALEPSRTLVARPTAGISILPTVVVSLGRFTFAARGGSAARAELPTGYSNTAIAAEPRMFFFVRKVKFISPSFSASDQAGKTGLLSRTHRFGNRGEESRLKTH